MGSSDPNSIAWNKFLDSVNSPYSNPSQPSIRKLGGGGDTRGYGVSQTFSTVGALANRGSRLLRGKSAVRRIGTLTSRRPTARYG